MWIVTKGLDRRLARHAPAVLSAFRLVYGLLFAAYGSRSLFDWPVRSPVVVAFGSWPGWYAGLIEIVAGLLVAAGLFTRTAAFIASGEMAVAYFWMHQPMALWPVADPPGGNGGARQEASPQPAIMAFSDAEKPFPMTAVPEEDDQ
ncbi:membrane protein [Mycobacterium intracellulare]|nr:membrane protein [Mycobacterium intracellulare]BCO80239.1 membrane protein [Mycobacterium intracellulare]BCP22215.1 membrane protein [Mycobacterium intracellulare]BCP33213.1 membrane protein [Mycobacterium intracellulare]BCP44159.1 membrane protein [Mycobacterium intracellulare]